MNSNHKYIIFILASSFSFIGTMQVNAQNDGQVEDRVVVIQKESKIELPNANRNFEKISALPLSPAKQEQAYIFKDIAIDLPTANPKLKVPTITPDPLDKLYPNYVKVGLGNYTTTYLEAFANSKRSDKFNYGAHFKHFASQNGPVKSERVKNLSRYSNNNLNGYVKYFTGKNTINADIDFDRTRVNYYGLNTEVLDTVRTFGRAKQDSLKQVYSVFSLGASIDNSMDTDSPLKYIMGFRFYNLGDHYQASENEIVLNGALSYKLSDKDGITVDADFSSANRKDSSSLNRSFFQIKPKYWIQTGIFTIKGGINVAYTNDTLKKFDKLHFYPSLHADAVIDVKMLTAFAGLDGEMQKNTLRTFVKENPFLKTNTNLYHTNKALEFYVGARGLLSNKLNYKATISYTNYKNLYFFNNSIRDSSRFDIFYADGTTSKTSFDLDLSYEINSKMQVGANAVFNSYDVSSSDTLKLGAWHRPTSIVSLYSRNNIYDKIYFSLYFYYIGGIKARQFGNNSKTDETLPAILDLSTKIEYKVSNSFVAFIELNNIFGSKYQYYQYYQNKSINVLAGITYSF